MIWLILGLVLLILILVQFFLLGGFNSNDLKGLNINFIVSVITILTTVFLIDGLIQRHDSQRKLLDYLSTLKLSHEVFVTKLKEQYIHIITKEPISKDLNELVNELDRYIDKDFLRRKIKVLFINTESIFVNEEREMDYFSFLTMFKKNIEHEITIYLNRYASVIPAEVMNNILTIDNLMKSNLLVSLADYGLTDHRVNVDLIEYEPSEFIEIYRSIGNELIALEKYTLKASFANNTYNR